jgi:thiol-disulfide isomerase/thioredoxin
MPANQRRRFITLLASLTGGGLLLNGCTDFMSGSQSENAPEPASGATPGSPANSTAVPALNLPDRGTAPEFDNTSWINSEPIKLASLRGQPVLLEFWTFECINCRNVLPNLRAWYDQFFDKGLAFVSMHTPEFDSEKKLENVKQAVQELQIKYPVAQDNDFETWNKYHVRGWPTLFLIDKKGRIRYTQLGEGNYDQTKAAIQTLLAE